MGPIRGRGLNNEFVGGVRKLTCDGGWAVRAVIPKLSVEWRVEIDALLWRRFLGVDAR